MWIHYNTQPRNDFKYEKWARHSFFRIEDLDTQANLCEKNIYHLSKMTMETLQWEKLLCKANGFNNSINSKK